MKVVIDTSSLMALVRYYLPFDKENSLKELFKRKVENSEIIILDKVAVEAKRVSKGIIVEYFEFIGDRKNRYNTEALLPDASFLRDLEGRLCYTAQKNRLDDVKFENRKKEFLESTDVKLILYCITANKGILNLDNTLLVTEETRTENDNKLFKKLPEICDLLNIEHCNLPYLLKKHYNLKLSQYLL